MRAAHQLVNGSLVLSLLATLVVGAVLGRSSLVTAQSLGQGQPDPTFFPATGYRVTSPAVFDYFQQRGGVRTFGFPVSNDFPLLGHRIQIFQRQVLELKPDGTVTPVNILEPDVLPIYRIDGLNLPAVDLGLLANAPQPQDPDYAANGVAFVNAYVPDQWEDLQVNFLSTYLNSVTCADAFGPDPAACDPSLLPGFAFEIWGIPTSLPTPDPLNSEFVYQRFQRGIMHYSRATGLTQGLLVGDWFKRVLIGLNLSPDIGPEVRASRFFGQFAPSRPLGLARPDELPDTSLVQAFRSESLATAAQQEPTLPPSVAQTATAVALTATAVTATQMALEGTSVSLTATAVSLTATAVTPGPGIPTTTPQAVVSDIPVTNEGCLGDEQMWFVPRRPNLGTRVEISVTSRRHHDIRFLRLVGPLDAGTPIERLGVFGFTWTWTVVPAVEDFHQWTFYADGLRPCITSGFNTFAPLGATATPTITPEPTGTPGEPTATPTGTPLPVPTISDSSYSGLSCGQLLTIRGTNFGSPPSNNGTFATLVIGSSSFQLQPVGTGSNTQLRVLLPPSGSNFSSTSGVIFVSNNESDSNSVPASFTSTCA